MLLYECSDDFPDHHLNYTGKCYGSNMPPPVKDCTGISTIAAWAIGGKVGHYTANRLADINKLPLDILVDESVNT